MAPARRLRRLTSEYDWHGVMTMRISELRNKELIDLASGNRLGAIGDADLVVDELDGRIVSMIMPDRSGGGFTIFSRVRELSVPWTAVRKIGPDIVIVELEPGHGGSDRPDGRNDDRLGGRFDDRLDGIRPGSADRLPPNEPGRSVDVSRTQSRKGPR